MMENSAKTMEKRIRSVRAWLERAERSYAEKSGVKGQVQLLMAKAEMQYLNEQQHTNWRLPLAGIVIIILAVASWGGSWMMKSVEPSFSPEQNISRQFTFEQGTSGVSKFGYIKLNSGTTFTGAESTAVVSVGHKAETQAPMPQAPANVPIEMQEEPKKTISTQSKIQEVPVLDAAQIKAAVYDGGRSLRGN